MFTSESIKQIAPALLAAQSKMGAAIKGSKNPFFRSNYADLGAVLEACKELLNENGITILQPTGRNEHGTYVETTLLHNSGEFISSVTPVIFAKEGDPQAQGSAITYARRYGLQSLVSLPAEDDDGEKAMSRNTKKDATKPVVKEQGLLDTAKSLNDPVTTSTIITADTKPKTTFRRTGPTKTETAPVANGATDDLGLN
jgi:hypothetical protein